MRKIITWVAMLLIVPLIALAGTTTAASALTCTNSGSVSGDNFTGNWSRHICTDGGATVGYATVYWDSYTSNGDRYVSYSMSVATGPIQGNDCVYIAMDWDRDGGAGSGHEDAQHMRNCRENTTYNMGTWTFNLDKYCDSGGYCAPYRWFTNRLQVGVYDGDSNTVRSRVCPSGVAPATDYGHCNDWSANPTWNSLAAKIHRKANDGSEAVNDPQTYDVKNIINAYL